MSAGRGDETAGGKALAEALGKLGRAAGLDRATPTKARFHAVLLAVKQSGADCARYLLHLRKRSRHFRRHCASLGVNIPWSDRLRWCSVVDQGWQARRCSALTAWRLRGRSTRLRRPSANPIARLQERRRINQSAWPYDAVTILAAAINKAGSTDPTKIREAILAIKNMPARKASINFDQERRRPARATTS